MVTLTKHVIPGLDLHFKGPLALMGYGIFATSSCQTLMKAKKKFYYLSAGPAWHCAIWQIRRW